MVPVLAASKKGPEAILIATSQIGVDYSRARVSNLQRLRGGIQTIALRNLAINIRE
jgi:hypothetical protein